VTSSSSSTADTDHPASRDDRRIEGLLAGATGGGFSALAAGLLPDRELTLQAVVRLHRLLVPETLTAAGDLPTRRRRIAEEIAAIEPLLAEQVLLALAFRDHVEARDSGEAERRVESRELAREVIDRLPELRQRLFEDARAAYRGDPSCRDPVEAMYAFPGMLAITRHRIAHLLYQQGVPLLPRLISERAHTLTGIDIHPGAEIGREFFIDHGTGVVIGETSIIGDRVTLYQGVTLGAKSFQVDASGQLVKGQPRHPIVEDDVTIYASATVLGRVIIGRGSVIGGNVWLTHSVPPGSRVYQAEAIETGFEQGGGI
jgi:serine O-acetyltransferase